MNRIGIIGAFDFKGMSKGGQPVKTRQLYATLCKEYGNTNVKFVDTQSWKKHILTVALSIINVIFSCKIIIMLPASNGVYVFSKLLVILKKLLRKRIIYDVIGGWLPDLAEENEVLKNELVEFDYILVETNTMREKLNRIGFNNVYVVRNYKELIPMKVEALPREYSAPFKLCTFSRVMKEKGIEDAIKAVTSINRLNNSVIYTLDIYGGIDTKYAEQFSKMIKSFPKEIKYKGEIDPYESVHTLNEYFLLLFPTRFYTEGVPGTIIDSYASGVPVLSSEWESCNDVVKAGKTGLTYEFGCVEELEKTLRAISETPETVAAMKKGCLEEYSYYTEATFKNQIIQFLKQENINEQ